MVNIVFVFKESGNFQTLKQFITKLIIQDRAGGLGEAIAPGRKLKGVTMCHLVFCFKLYLCRHCYIDILPFNSN